MTSILQIVPYLPPSISGVGDYAFLLGKELHRTHGITTHFVLTDPDWKGGDEIEGFPVTLAKERSAAALERLLVQEAADQEPVVLHYVGYGYQKRGCPSWLVGGIERWKRAKNGAALLTMFHELYAKPGPFRSSSFWNSSLQRRLAVRLARCTDRCRTNRAKLAREIGRMVRAHSNKTKALPVFSNFGEPQQVSPLQRRQPKAVLFAGLGRGLRDVNAAQTLLPQALSALGLDAFTAFGKTSRPPAQLRAPVAYLPDSAPERISQELSASRVGMLDYFDGELAKSGIFAAYCAHGVAPVLTLPNASQSDGLEPGRHFLVASELNTAPSVAEQQTVADAARAWYARHNVQQTACAFAEDLSNLLSQSETRPA